MVGGRGQKEKEREYVYLSLLLRRIQITILIVGLCYYKYLRKGIETREIALRLEDLGSALSTHVAAHNCLQLLLYVI